ncbi:MAG TPA: DUF167 domain-containing protein [Pyrinomonadaceae bacterium]|nr:DUF167 domain-containing protein [Pyrinomonadaceae bacterium]
MIHYTEKNGATSFQVYVVARASRSQVAGEHNGALRVRVAAPPADGAANRELIRLLAELFDVGRSNIEIASGESSRLKRICVRACTAAVLDSINEQRDEQR